VRGKTPKGAANSPVQVWKEEGFWEGKERGVTARRRGWGSLAGILTLERQTLCTAFRSRLLGVH